MTAFTFAPATKAQAKARLALDGPSGGGKTWTALTVATVLAKGGKIAVIDTERGSASKYSDVFTFDTLQLHSFEPDTLVKALAVAASGGYSVVVVDSLSHFWMGTGGMLQQVDNAAKRTGGGNSFAGWKDAAPLEQKMLDALLAFPGHVIITMRTKTEWVVEENDRGKKVPRRVGTKPVQRDGIEYEFDVIGELDLDNTLVVTKSRAPMLSGAVVRKPDSEFAQTILDWLTDGEPALDAVDYEKRALADGTDFEGMVALHNEVKAKGLLGAVVMDSTGQDITLGELIVNRGKALRGDS